MNAPSIPSLGLAFLVGILGAARTSTGDEPVVGGSSNAPATNTVVEMVKSPLVFRGLINSRNPFVHTVGTDTNGVPIQQVEWLYRKSDLKEQQCPIWAGAPVTVVREEDGAVRIRCDKTALPDEQKWHEFVFKGNIVTGWLKKDAVIRVSMSDWKKNRLESKPTTHVTNPVAAIGLPPIPSRYKDYHFASDTNLPPDIIKAIQSTDKMLDAKQWKGDSQGVIFRVTKTGKGYEVSCLPYWMRDGQMGFLGGTSYLAVLDETFEVVSIKPGA